VSTLGARALGLAVDGFRVFPAKPNSRAPLTRHGFKDASTDLDLIARWWERCPDANVGIATGDGLFVVDVDVKNGVDGEATWRALQATHGAAPMTRMVVSPSGGGHRYFSTIEVRVPCSVGKLGRGIDIRGIGGYVVAAGVIDGNPYVTLPYPIAPAPGWLLELVRERTHGGRSVAEWRQLAGDGVVLGRRNSTIASFAGHLLRKGVDPWVVLELMRTWNQARCHPPLPDAELVSCTESIARRELGRRMGPRS
jgi:hypothetical protein